MELVRTGSQRPKMDKNKTAFKAKCLWSLLDKYALTNDSAMKAFNALRALLLKASSGQINSPLKWIEVPCGYLFVEGDLGRFKDLEEAYAEFKVEVTGGNDQLMDKIKNL